MVAVVKLCEDGVAPLDVLPWADAREVGWGRWLGIYAGGRGIIAKLAFLGIGARERRGGGGLMPLELFGGEIYCAQTLCACVVGVVFELAL